MNKKPARKVTKNAAKNAAKKVQKNPVAPSFAEQLGSEVAANMELYQKHICVVMNCEDQFKDHAAQMIAALESDGVSRRTIAKAIASGVNPVITAMVKGTHHVTLVDMILLSLMFQQHFKLNGHK